MKRCVLAMLLPCLGCAAGSSGKGAETATAAAVDVEVAAVVPGSEKLFAGPEGLALAQIKLADETYLMQIRGSDSLVAGKVLPYRLVDNGRSSQIFVTQIDGREFWVLHRNRRYGSTSYRVTVPYDKMRRDITVSYDEEKSKGVEPQQLVASYRKILADGSLAELQRFKRDQEEASERKGIEKGLAALNKACQTQIEMKVDWKSIDDETLRKLSISGYCSPPVFVLKSMCKKSPGVAKLVASQLRTIHCAFGEERSIQLFKSELSWTIKKGATNAEKYAKKYLTERAPWQAGKRPAEVTYLENTDICSDGKSVYVGRHPHRAPKEAGSDYEKQIFFGDGKAFKRVPRRKYVGSQWFYDPRFFVSTHNANMRGADYRYHSQFRVDEKSGACKVTCAKRELKLRLLPKDESTKLMATATFVEPKGQRVPYGLSRDRRGIYYYVDRGPEKDSRDFRLFRGPTGRLRPMKMTNIVSDTKGDVFSTRSGSLRLVLEQPNSYWIKRGKRAKLINVPIADNLQLIYNELGIYLGQPFNTPCDLL